MINQDKLLFLIICKKMFLLELKNKQQVDVCVLDLFL